MEYVRISWSMQWITATDQTDKTDVSVALFHAKSELCTSHGWHSLMLR